MVEIINGHKLSGYGYSFEEVETDGCLRTSRAAEGCCADYDREPRGYGAASSADHRRPGAVGKRASQGDEVSTLLIFAAA